MKYVWFADTIMLVKAIPEENIRVTDEEYRLTAWIRMPEDSDVWAGKEVVVMTTDIHDTERAALRHGQLKLKFALRSVEERITELNDIEEETD